MTKTYSCPKCGAEVLPKDINVAKDIMLCPACGEVSSFSEVVGEIDSQQREDEGRRLLSAPPPKHLTVVTDPTDLSDKIVCIYHKFSWVSLFLIPFTAVWAGGSMTAIYGTQILKHHFDPFASLFGIPFLLGSIFLVSITLFSIFGKYELTLERGRGRYFWGVGKLGFWRNFTYGHNTEISQEWSTYNHKSGPTAELQLKYPGSANTVHLGAGLDEDALDYLEALLKREAALY